MARRPPRWYFSFRSPYSWLAYHDLLTHYPDVADGVEWLPFWEPEETFAKELAGDGIALPYATMSKAKHLYILQDVRRLTAERGLTMVWPIDREPRWEVAHLAYLVAQDAGRGREFVDAVYRARWERGRNISDPATMAEVGEELGLDPAPLADAADDPEIRERGLLALRALDRDDVFGVPFFIQGHDKFWGVDRLPGFAAAHRKAVERRREG
ncbi:2-hydroxychromene-2-carboxylate isomerase [Streptomyces zhaozhouensis]|uniref:2-hydroxychromene-2-carboxylate isomerase n=1 Tax=Streptomyces zhaozhouensis TaxID=1300267 RepID=A0A286DVA8_9ACTN|nr:DsbA family protein [Streptomyces zhaozhouensis]SOD62592.1 2-hydroxychromene-2-carboxylate isomerase [Streptomyces zhaozhouensis]